MFLDALFEFLNKEYKDKLPITIDNIIPTLGASQSLFNMLTWFSSNDTIIFMEDPSYFLAADVINDVGMKERVIPVKCSDSGIDVDYLETILEKNMKLITTSLLPFDNTTGKFPKFKFILYTVPIFNNPTGKCLTPNAMEKLYKLSQKYSMLVICDDVYTLLYYNNPSPPKRLFAYANTLEERDNSYIISNNSFSKIFGPGLRLGWIEASPRIIQCIRSSGLMASGGSPNCMTGLMSTMMRAGKLGKHVEKLRRDYGQRMKAMMDVLDAELPKSVTYTKPDGGFFIWLELPTHLDAFNLFQQVMESKDGEKVVFAYGSRFSVSGESKNCIRICFTFYEIHKLVHGTRMLCQLLNIICAK